jgi:gliding motility-associated peptidyl-prolyl isomerase
MKKLIAILLLCNYSCSEIIPRHPLNKKKVTFLNQSAHRNKKLFTHEEQELREAASRDSLLNFNSTEAGFLYAYKKQVNKSLDTPQKGELVRFQYQIEDLNNKVIYDKNMLGIVEYSIDQEDLLPGLREGLRIMKTGEVVVFLFPSYLCYGYQGDGEKISANQPLRFTIERLSNIKNNL